MNENTLQVIAILKIVWTAGFVGLYGFGGISGKWKRRLVGSAWMGLGVFGFSQWTESFHWWYLIYPALLCISLHLGYGGNDVKTKLRKRFIYGSCLGLSALPLCYPSGLFYLFGGHVSLCIFASVFLGVFNPTRNARSEETLIAVLSTVIPLFLI